jgi:hypothetical protein
MSANMEPGVVVSIYSITVCVTVSGSEVMGVFFKQFTLP